MNDTNRKCGRARRRGHFLLYGIVCTIAACGAGVSGTGIADGTGVVEVHAAAPLNVRSEAPPAYFGDEYAEAERALQERPQDPEPPSF
jgi:hypothetical protein